MEIAYASPLSGRRLALVTEFLRKQELDYDPGCTFSVLIFENDELVATGSLEKNILKCIAVSPDCQGEGLAAKVVSELVSQAIRQGQRRLFLFTKPHNRILFGGLGFYPVAATSHILLMENERDGVKKFVESVRQPDAVPAGAIVANCNPFTNGHRWLVETAAKACERLYVFVLSEEQPPFPAADRLRLVQEGTADLENVTVCPTGPYLISSATFPTYFIKEKDQAADFNAELDLTIFAECFAKPLGITKRFVGTEPFCQVTSRYNQQMKAILPAHGIEVAELTRFAQDGQAVSASRVRALLAEGKLEELRRLVPETTYRYLKEGFPNG